MKIEIEYEEVDRLKRTIERQEKEIKALEAKLAALDKTAIENNAVILAKNMFEAYVKGIFAKIGFEYQHVDWGDNLEHWLGKGWYISDKLTVTFGATITAEFRKAFLRLGIAIEEKPNDK